MTVNADRGSQHNAPSETDERRQAGQQIAEDANDSEPDADLANNLDDDSADDGDIDAADADTDEDVTGATEGRPGSRGVETGEDEDLPTDAGETNDTAASGRAGDARRGDVRT